MKPVLFQEESNAQYREWAKTNKKTFKKIVELIKDIQRDSFNGIGKPEPLKHQYKGFWSRRITLEHRLIYQISPQNEIIIISCKGHYSN